MPIDETLSDEQTEAVPPPPVDEAPDADAGPQPEPAPEPDAPPEPAAPPALDGVAVLARLDAIDASIAEYATLERRHVGIIEELHADNTQLRQGEVSLAIKPILLGIARLYDDVNGIIERGGEAFAGIDVVRELVADLLERQGVTKIDPPDGEPFDSKLHAATGVNPTDDPALDTTIAVVERVGFIRDGAHVVRPAQVLVHRHLAQQSQPAESPRGVEAVEQTDGAPSPTTDDGASR